MVQEQGLLSGPEAELFAQQLHGFRLGQLPSIAGAGVRGWAQVCNAWRLLGSLGCGAEDEENVQAELLHATGGNPLRGDPKQIERELMRSNRYAHYLYLSLYPQLVAQRWQQDAVTDNLPGVLCVAEKPSVAKMIAEHLSGGRMRFRKGVSRACQVYEFNSWFPPAGEKCKLLVTSVVGHVFGLDFNKGDNRGAWNDPSILYDAR